MERPTDSLSLSPSFSLSLSDTHTLSLCFVFKAVVTGLEGDVHGPWKGEATQSEMNGMP